MKEVLNSLFTETNFDVDEITSFIGYESFFAKRKTNEKLNFFVVLFLEEKNLENFNLEATTTISEQIKKLDFYEASMDKNTSLLICLNYESSIDDELQKYIFSIEEDPYDFKKYLLIYSSDQARAFKNEISLKQEVLKELNCILLNTERFNKFKEKKETDLSYELVTKLFIKLPFLTIDLDEEKEMKDIQGMIDQEIAFNRNEKTKFSKQTFLEFGEMLLRENLDEENVIKEFYRMGGIIVE